MDCFVASLLAMTLIVSRASSDSPLLPPAAMTGRSAARSRGGAEFGAGLARVGGLEDFGATGEFGFARFGAARTVGQGFRAVHFVEVGFVDFGGAGTTRGWPLTPTLSP